MNSQILIDNITLFVNQYEQEIKKRDEEIENLKNINTTLIEKHSSEIKELSEKFLNSTSEELSIKDTKFRMEELENEIKNLVQVNTELKTQIDEFAAKIKILTEENQKLNQTVQTQKKLIDILQNA